MRIASVLFMLLALGGFAYAFIKMAVINGPFMILIGISSFLTLLAGITAGVGSGRANLNNAHLSIKELTEKVALLGDANDGLKANFDARVAEAVKAFKEGYNNIPKTENKGNIAQA